MRMLNSPHMAALATLLCSSLLVGCQPTALPAAQRPAVELPILAGDLTLGKQVFVRECSKCHQLGAGRNSKAPQLERVYGAPAGTLADYHARYSSAMRNSGWRWDVATLDRYLADPEVALPNGKMLSDPLPDAAERRAVIAYLSTLR